MKPYVHHIPGRLRVRSSQLNCSDPRTAALLDSLRGLAGVIDVTCNEYARCITVRYDPGQLDKNEIYASFADSGCLDGKGSASGPSSSGPKLAGIFNKLVWLALEKTLERSVVSLVSPVR